MRSDRESRGSLTSILLEGVSMDVIIVALPVPMIWKLHLKTADKLMLMGLFLLGAM